MSLKLYLFKIIFKIWELFCLVQDSPCFFMHISVIFTMHFIAHVRNNMNRTVRLKQDQNKKLPTGKNTELE